MMGYAKQVIVGPKGSKSTTKCVIKYVLKLQEKYVKHC